MTEHERALFNKGHWLANELKARNCLDGTSPEQMADAMLTCGRDGDPAVLTERMESLWNAVCQLNSRSWEKRALLEQAMAGLTEQQAQRSLALMACIFGDKRSKDELEQLPPEELIETVISRSGDTARIMRDQMEEAMDGLELSPDQLKHMAQTDPFLVAAVLDWAQEEGDVQLDVPPELFAAGAAALRETARLSGELRTQRVWLATFCDLVVVVGVALLVIGTVTTIFPAAPVTKLILSAFSSTEVIYQLANCILLCSSLGMCAAKFLILSNETKIDTGLYQVYSRLQDAHSQRGQTSAKALTCPEEPEADHVLA